MFNAVENVTMLAPEERSMTTGKYVVREFMCKHCSTQVGWLFEKAFDASQQYKEGKCVLEMTLVVLG